jgi:hypothetical protein
MPIRHKPEPFIDKRFVTMKTLLIATALAAGVGFAVAQNPAPDNKSEAAAPAPPSQRNAPPDKVAPGPANSPNAVPPDAKVESHVPALKMDSDAGKKAPAFGGETQGQGAKQP